jgi:hypothetical protein
MRLGQLARKLSVRPSQLVDFLAKKQIHLEEGSNARLQDEHVIALVNYFAPERLQEIVTQTKVDSDNSVESTSEVTPAVVIPEPEEIKEKEEILVENVQVEESQEIELIKAPKVELTGLKVLGKIELPEPKKKEVSETETTDTTQEQVEKIKSRPATKRNITRPERQTNQKSWQNPIAVQREREQREAEEKKQAALEREKEKRRIHYLNKVKTGQPTKAIRLYDEAEEAPVKPVAAKPKTLWGKFINWLNN